MALGVFSLPIPVPYPTLQQLSLSSVLRSNNHMTFWFLRLAHQIRQLKCVCHTRTEPEKLSTSFWSVRYVYALLLWFDFLGRFFARRLFGRVAELRPRYKPLDFRPENDDTARHLDRC
jgi:hypothetical protein